MADSLSITEWMPVLVREYLRGFVKDGGAAVKFCVGYPSTRGDLLTALKEESDKQGYFFASVDAATTKLHFVDEVFHAVAEQMDWDASAIAFLRSVVGEKHFLPEGRLALEELATSNGLDTMQMRKSVNQLLTDKLFHDYAMTQEFRLAMLGLCQAQLEPTRTGLGMPDPIKEWLRGELRLISALRRSLIFQRIGRHNGQHMLHSLAHWLHLTGKSGLVLTLDVSRLLEARRVADGSLNYSKAAVLEAYEVIRQFVDATDELRYGLVVVVAPENAVLSEDPRGFPIYNALWQRIADEVRDRHQPNPLGTLVRLGLVESAATDSVGSN